MFSFKPRYALMLCAAVMLILLMMLARAAVMDAREQETGTLGSDDASLRFAYSQLTERQQELYAALCEGIEKQAAVIDLPGSFTAEEYEHVYLLVSMQEPQFFYLDEMYQLAEKMGSAEMFYTAEGEQAESMTRQLEQAADAIVRGLSPAQNENQKLLYLHDRLAAVCEYDKSEHSDDAYGALVEGIAQCEGYAKAFTYLARRAGLNVMCVPGTTKRTPHMWNIAQIDGAYYHIDVTWDDDASYGGDTAHTCFAVPDALFGDHMPDTSYFVPPVCTGLQEMYCMTRGLVLNAPGDLSMRLKEWIGVYPLTEFFCRDAQSFAEVKNLLQNDKKVGEVLYQAGTAGKKRFLLDDERYTVVILP